APNRDRKKGRPAYAHVTTVTFEEMGGKTRLTVRSRFESAQVREVFSRFGMNAGWSQSLDRLGENLTGTSTADRELIASRVLDAPRDLVWKAFTDPRHIAQWWGPKGFTNTIETMQVRPGGLWKFVMHGPDGKSYPNEVTFVEVVERERLVY